MYLVVTLHELYAIHKKGHKYFKKFCSVVDFPPLVNPDYLVPFRTLLSGNIIFVLLSWFLLLYQIFLCENLFDLGASAGVCDFCELVQIGLDLYIFHRKYQSKSFSSPWFSATCVAVCTNKRDLVSYMQSSAKHSIVVKYFLDLPHMIMVKMQDRLLATKNVTVITLGELQILLKTVNLLLSSFWPS